MKNWDKYSKEHYLFILSQAEKRINSQVEVLNSIQTRGQLQAIFAVTAATYFINEIVKADSSWPLVFSYTFLITLMISTILSIIGIFKYIVHYSGSSSKDLMSENFYQFDDFADNELNMLYSECIDYKTRIESNKSVSKKKVKLVTWSFILLFLSPLFALIVSLIAKFL
jgi:hypothetical protein